MMHLLRRIFPLSGAFLLCAAFPAGAEVTRTLELRLPGATPSFTIENLVGEMNVSSGTGDAVVITATVHAESQELAEKVALRTEADSRIHVVYPDERRLRYPRLNQTTDDDWNWTFDFFSGTRIRYDGRSYRIRQHGGTLLYVDLDVRIPGREVHGRFDNLVGRLNARGVSGDLTFHVASADSRLEQLSGNIHAEGASGDVRADGIRGTWTSHFSSGDVVLENFEGDSASFEASSGDVRIDGLSARKVSTSTSSGDIRIRDADVAEYDGEASSGDIELDQRSSRLSSFHVRTTSGDIVLRVPEGTALEARAHQSSGDMRVEISGGEKIRDDEKLVGYRAGSGGAKVEVRTTSGDFLLARH